jgi:glutamate dehydrogenase
MGITARGAWESVKRHFREMGKDIQSEDFTVVGCGDMSGDVFGNGMLLSRHTKLLAAFNHMHVFVDPDPDPEASFEERRRLFDLPRSTWADYDAGLISEGGAVFDRAAKSITVSPQVKALVGLESDTMPPNDLIRAILKADVELLWLGGIGTYVKARSESHADVGDHANDHLRIDGPELRARVVGEGANLGMTQLGRIEYARSGGRLNVDAIDNSAGVDCSDHEVNIKILLGKVERAGDMTRKQRDRLLERMTDEVAELVLRDNYLQAQAIAVTHNLGAHMLDRLARVMRELEKSGHLDRAIEFLPDDEVLAERFKKREGFTRPELAVLLSYAKIVLYDELLASDLPDAPYMERGLREYFPQPLQDDFSDAIAKHRLRREIIATVVTNEMVNRVGISFVHEVKEKTGMPGADIARAYVVSREILGVDEMWRALESDPGMNGGLQTSMLAECGRAVERCTVWFLREIGQPLDMTAAPEELAYRTARLPWLPTACDIVRIATACNVAVERAARVYFKVGKRFGFNWLRRSAGHLPSDTSWEKRAVSAVVDDLFGHQFELTRHVFSCEEGDESPVELIECWSKGRGPLVARTDQLLAELHSVVNPDLAMLAVASRQLKSMSVSS